MVSASLFGGVCGFAVMVSFGLIMVGLRYDRLKKINK
jgi:hypothetical protein